MKTKAIITIILTVFLASMLTLAFNIQTIKAEPTIIIVPDDYPTIQQAVNLANTGDTIYVRAGIYYENVVLHSWDSGLRLVGENRDTTIIDGGGRLWVMWVGADYTVVNGFTLRNGGYGYGGIRLDNSDNSLVDNTFISNNWLGIEILRSNDNTLQGNVIDSNTQWGILIDYDSSYNTIKSNDISYNHYGIGLSTHPSFPPGIIDNVIYHNNFISNTEQVWINPWGGQIVANIWDDGYPSGGNYWSDYIGPDANGDDIGDTPYVIDENNIDRYPLMKPWDNIPPVANAGPDQTVYEDTLVTFDGSGSSDNIGIANYMWTFIDVTPQTLTGVDPTYTFTTPGIYTVTLDISDAAGNHATDTVTITVLGPEAGTQRLIETIETWNLSRGTEKSITSKLEDALHLLEKGNENGAIYKLMDCINQVEGLRGKKLTNEQADYLIAEAQRIISLIEG